MSFQIIAVCLAFLCLQSIHVTAFHPNCISTGDRFDKEVICNGEVTIPDNFDVTLYLSALHTKRAIFKGVRNVAYENAIAFPNDTFLDEVEFTNFNRDYEHPRFPLNVLLRQLFFLRVIRLSLVKMETLTAGDLRGFHSLEELTLDYCYLASVSVTAFDELGFSLDGSNVFSGQLEKLTITDYQLTALDWAVFTPVEKTLKSITLQATGITSHTLTNSNPGLVLSAVWDIFLEYNELKELPAVIYNSLNPDQPLRIFLEGNPICRGLQGRDCSCCEMADFAHWLRAGNMRIASLGSIQCGTGRPMDGVVALANPDLHQHCR